MRGMLAIFTLYMWLSIIVFLLLFNDLKAMQLHVRQQDALITKIVVLQAIMIKNIQMQDKNIKLFITK